MDMHNKFKVVSSSLLYKNTLDPPWDSSSDPLDPPMDLAENLFLKGVPKFATDWSLPDWSKPDPLLSVETSLMTGTSLPGGL